MTTLTPLVIWTRKNAQRAVKRLLPSEKALSVKRCTELCCSARDATVAAPQDEGFLVNACSEVLRPMNSIPFGVLQDTEHLGVLAMKFRGTRSEGERHDIARDYSQTVERLIQSGVWHEMSAPEDQLPDDWMPRAFLYSFWQIPRSSFR